MEKRMTCLWMALLMVVTMQAGQVVYDTIQGIPCRVYIPARVDGVSGASSIDGLSSATTREPIYPVLYLQHGMWGDEHDWVNKGDLRHIVDSLLAEEAIVPMIIIMPDNCPHRATSEQEMANGMSGEWERHFAQFMAAAEAKYPISSDPARRAIAGLSMGGFHAMHVSHHLPDAFAYVGLFSPAIYSQYDADVYAHWEEEVLQQMPHNRLYWIAIGTEDFLYGQVKKYRQWLDAHKLRYSYYESTGGHTWPNWREYIIRFLQLLPAAGME